MTERSKREKIKMSVLNAVRAKLVTIMFAVIRADAFFSRNIKIRLRNP